MSKDWTGNGNSVFKILGASSHTAAEREANDYYATDPAAIDKLLTVERPNHRIWECACGEGHLSERLHDYGFCVSSSDVINRGYKRQFENQDFLKAESVPFRKSFDILTNPPYKYAKEFVIKALELLPNNCKCYMFLKLTFLEGRARYKEIFGKTPPKNVYVFSKRIQCAKNAEFEKLKAGGGSAVAYAWFVWQKGYKGKTTLAWI